ncbi:hypothetical protein OIO90_005665 [Microbotryomycetes sp. JL221]|nr:hypothetical protein OIO90_005665 [Microbotryomycetes sp. JL221]
MANPNLLEPNLAPQTKVVGSHSQISRINRLNENNNRISPTLPRTMPDLPEELEPELDNQEDSTVDQSGLSNVGGTAMATRRSAAVAAAANSTTSFQQEQPPPPPSMMTSRPVVTQFVQADLDTLDGDEDDDEDESANVRPKKRSKKNSGKVVDVNTAQIEATSQTQQAQQQRHQFADDGASGAEGGAGTSGDNGEEKGRRKIEIEYIQKKEKRHITFSKRKAGIMKKAYELATLTGTQVLLLVVSETGIVYTFTTSAFQPLVGAREDGSPSDGQRLIQQCLSVDPNADKSDYISPPPDGPLLPLPPKAQKRPFEANSSIHGGQIALRARQHRPSNRSKGRPSAINTQRPASGLANPNELPHPSVLQPVDSQPLQLPVSPHHMHPMHQAPHHSPSSLRGDYPSPALPSGRSDHQMQNAQEYAEMMHHHRGSISGPSYTHHPGAGYATGPSEYMMPHGGHHASVERHYRGMAPHPSQMSHGAEAHYAYDDERYGGTRGGLSSHGAPAMPADMYSHPSQQGHAQSSPQQQGHPGYEDGSYLHRTT